MMSHQASKEWKAGRHWPLVFLCLVSGCAAAKHPVDKSLVQSSRAAEVSEHYQICCPDVVEVSVAGRSLGPRRVGPDGRIDLGPLGQLRAEGNTIPQVERAVAAATGVPPSGARVRIAEFNSQQVYVFGEVNGLQRAVPYRGQETVVELLRRAGGLAEGAEPEDVCIVRANVASGGRPEVFPVQLQDILSGKDSKTNLKVQPFDHVYIGETRQSCLMKCLPPCLRPLYQSLCGLKASQGRGDAEAQKRKDREIEGARVLRPL